MEPQSFLRRFLAELRRRRVFRIAVAYAIVAWVLIEVASVIFPALDMPDWSLRLVILLALFGFPIALVLAWAVQLEPGSGGAGATAEPGAPPPAEAAPVRRAAAFALIAIVLIVVGVSFHIVRQPPADARSGAAPGFATAGMSALTQLTFSAGIEEYPAFASGGDRLAFSRDVGGYRQVFVRSLATGQEERVTSEPYDHIQPAWSPRGDALLYVRAREPETKLEPADVFDRFVGGDIWRVELATRQHRRLLEDAYHPAYSRDGARIAFDVSWSGARRIWVADSLGRNARQVTTDASEAISHIAPAWSPDGRRIVFQNIEKTKMDIRVLDLASGTLTWITDDRFRDVYPAWSADGSEILFSSPRGGGWNLWRVAVAPDGRPEAPPRQITTGAGQDLHVSVALDGRRLAFAILNQNADLWQLPVSPERGAAIGPPEPLIATTREESRGAWSPDGGRIAFNSDRGGEMNLWLYEPEDGVTQQLTSGPGGDYQPRWSPDGRTLVFFSSRSGNADIWTIDVQTGQLQQLTTEPGLDVNPFYAPDSRSIAFQSDRGGRKELWVMAADGSNPRQVTTEGVGDHFMLWTDDARSILVSPVDGEGALQVFLDGGSPRELPWIPNGAHMSFSPDRSLILDVVGHHSLRIAPVAGGEPRHVFEFEDPEVRIDYPTWSPDGRSVIFDRHKPTSGDIWMLDLGGIASPTI